MPPREPFDPDPSAAPFEPRHAVIRAEVRDWVATHLAPYADEWEAAREFPRSVYRDAGAAGLLGWKYDERWGGRGPDPLADVVVAEELVRSGSGGVAAGLGATKDLAPYYVARFGTDEQRERWLRPAVTGDAVAGLAVTEPGAGSDVAAVTTSASRDGDGWRLRGTKVFCTNGSRADWLLVAARTVDEPGPHSLALFVVPTDAPGFTSTRIPTLGWRTSQTGLLHFDDVALPADAILGAEREGFVMIMKSFQWERLCLAVGSVSAAAANLAAARDLMTGTDDADDVPARARLRVVELAQQLASVRALTYAALVDHLAGREPLRQVSAAKWLACDLDVETALLRAEAAAPRGEAASARADRALRDARLGPIGGGAREVMAELVARTLGM
ncbi:MAG TPA: acyl-CoA dehydrogenase family protein [Mycobacteriales bacterium]|nr:acyl-CoA dehydrogenase family protein [Mycobacteriales bacterium]